MGIYVKKEANIYFQLGSNFTNNEKQNNKIITITLNCITCTYLHE